MTSLFSSFSTLKTDEPNKPSEPKKEQPKANNVIQELGVYEGLKYTLNKGRSQNYIAWSGGKGLNFAYPMGDRTSATLGQGVVARCVKLNLPIPSRFAEGRQLLPYDTDEATATATEPSEATATAPSEATAAPSEATATAVERVKLPTQPKKEVKGIGDAFYQAYTELRERYELPCHYIHDGYDYRPTQVVPKWESDLSVRPISSFTEYMEFGDKFLVGESAKLAWASCLLAMVSGLPIIEQGRAGVNKTGIADMIAKLCPQAKKSGVTFSPQKPLGEIFGDMNVQAYTSHGVNTRDLASSPLGGHIVLLNELDKADDGIKQSLYDYVNERVYRESHREFKFDNRLLVIGTINEPLYDEPLEDRFSINVTLEAPKDHRWWLEAKTLEDNPRPTRFLTSDFIDECKERASIALHNLRTQAINEDNVEREPKNASEGFAYILNMIINDGYYLSGRKIKHMERVVSSFCAMQGRTQPQIADLWAISLCFFNQKIAKALQSKIETKLQIVKKIESKGKMVKSPYPFPIFNSQSDVKDTVSRLQNKLSGL